MAQQHALELVGPLGVRRFSAQVCEAHIGHAHHYDHDTIIIRGRVQVITESGQAEYGPGAVIPMPAQVAHTIKPLEDAEWLCVFSHRNFAGRITERYVGNRAAYDEIGPRVRDLAVRTPLTGAAR